MADTSGDVQVVKRTGTAALSDAAEAARQADELVSGAIKILKAPIEAPEFEYPDLDPLKAEIETVKKSAKSANEVVSTETERYNTAGGRETAAIEAKGQADADYVKAKTERAQQEADIYKSIADSMHVNAGDIAEVGLRLAKERPVAEQKLRKVQELQSRSFLDDPLDWLTGKIEEPSAVNDYNRQADIVNSLEDTLGKSIELANAGAQFNAKSIPTITAAMGKSEAESITQAAHVASAQADEKLAMQNVTFAQQKLANDLTQANLTKDMTQFEIDKAKMEWTADIKKIELSETHATRMLRAAELLDKLEKTKGLDVILSNYDTIMGNPKGTTTRYTFEKFGDAQRTNIVAIGAGSGGTDPFQALVNLSQSGLRPGPLFSSSKLLSWSQGRAEEIAKLPEIQNLDEKQKPLAISKRMKEDIMREKMNPTKLGSIFFEASPKEMIMSGAIAKDSPAAAMLAPLADQDQPVPTSVIVSMFTKAYDNPSQAGAALSDYYKRNIILRNSTNNYKLLGITPDETYKMTVRGSLFGGGFTLDLTKPADATKLILFNRAMENMKENARSFGKYG